MPDEGGGTPPERWVGLDLRHFDALEAIADTGSFHGAAARLGYTQSGISRQIASLERTVGRRLVNRPRAGTRLTLTEAGARLLTHASAIRARLAVAQADIATLSQRSELRVHAFPAAARTVMAPVLRALATRPGAPRVELAEAPEGNALFELVESGSIDFAIVDLPLFQPRGIAIESLLTDPFVLLVERSSPLGQLGRPLLLRELAGIPLVVFGRSSSTDRAVLYLRAHDIVPPLVHRAEESEALYGFVVSGLASALVPRLAASASAAEDLAVVELEPGIPPRRFGVAYRHEVGTTAAGELFLESVRAVCDELATE